MDIEYLRYVVETARIGSISKASNKLFISQSYLSRIIQEIEFKFNIIIFIRTNRGVELTEEGKEFVKYAKHMLNTYEKMNTIKNPIKSKDTLELKISSIRSSLSMEALILLERETKKSKVRLKLVESNNTDVIRDVYYLRSDIGVLVLDRKERTYAINQLKKMKLLYSKVSNLENHIVVGENHPLSKKEKINVEDLYNYGVIRYSPSFITKNNEIIGTSFTEFSPSYDLNKMDRVIEVDDRGSLNNILNNTDYYFLGIGTSRSEDGILGNISLLIDECDFYPNYEIGVIHNEEVGLNKESKRFIELLTDVSYNKIHI